MPDHEDGRPSLVLLNQREAVRCEDCGGPISERARRRRNTPYCASCRKKRRSRVKAAVYRTSARGVARKKAYRRRNRDRLRAYARAYRAAHRQRMREVWKRWYVSKRRERIEYAHLWNVQKRYGLSRDEYDTLVKRQNGLCAVCGKPPRSKFRLSVDHCHATGTVRGLLCSDCNLILGYAHDNPHVLRAAARYIEHHNPSNVPAQDAE